MKMLKCLNCTWNLNLADGRMGNVVTCEFCGTQFALDSILNAIAVREGNGWFIYLVKAIRSSFSMDCLKDLCAELYSITGGYQYEDIPGDTRNAKARELVQYAQRRGGVALLIQVAMEQNRNFALTMEAYNNG